MIISAAFLALTLSLDAFAAAFAYGCKRIRIPLGSGAIIAGVCTGVTAASFLVGQLVAPFFSERAAEWVAFGILFVIGCAKLLDSVSKALIRRYARIDKEVAVSLFNFKFMLRVYADPEAADADVSHTISAREAVVLAVSLSLDGFAVGLGAALMGLPVGWVVVFCLIANGLALELGSQLGQWAAQRVRMNISWLAGMLLIALAISQVV